jgi:CreA protein
MRNVALVLILSCLASTVGAEVIGSVATKFKWMGPNDRVVIEGSPKNSITAVPILPWPDATSLGGSESSHP